jgi:hypothetical protein
MTAKIPPSLNTTPFTKTPFYLYLYGADTAAANKWRGWTRQQVISSGRTWVLPLPDRNFGAKTELKATDEESTVSYPSAFGAGVGMSKQLVNSVAGAIPFVGSLVSEGYEKLMGHGMGGAGVPLDFTAMTVYGTKKRTFMFIFDLYALNSTDSFAIADFCREIHGLSMVRPGMRYLETPYVWTVEIVNDQGEKVTKNWLPDPGACAMTSFSHTPSSFMYTHEGKAPGRAVVSMTMTEIEPMAYNGSFLPTWGTAWDVGLTEAVRQAGNAVSTSGGLLR